MFTPQKTGAHNSLSQPDHYVVYGWQRSYFTHKLMAALHFYDANWEFLPKTADNEREIRLRSGTHQVPVLHTPENWMIGDTTPILHMLDDRFPRRRMFPRGINGIFVQVLEEYFDEWIARTTVHWRWNYEENHELLSLDATFGDTEKARQLIVWGGKVCRATGVSSTTQQGEAESEYHRLMAAAEKQLAETAYLLGDRPTALDCIVLAGLRAHFLYDPAPRRELYDRYPGVVAWVENRADDWDGRGEPVDFRHLTPFARLVLAEMAETYQRFAVGNRTALENGDKAFVIPMYGEEVSYLARPYIEQSRRMIVDRAKSELSVSEDDLLREFLGAHNLRDAFT